MTLSSPRSRRASSSRPPAADGAGAQPRLPPEAGGARDGPRRAGLVAPARPRPVVNEMTVLLVAAAQPFVTMGCGRRARTSCSSSRAPRRGCSSRPGTASWSRRREFELTAETAWTPSSVQGAFGHPNAYGSSSPLMPVGARRPGRARRARPAALGAAALALAVPAIASTTPAARSARRSSGRCSGPPLPPARRARSRRPRRDPGVSFAPSVVQERFAETSSACRCSGIWMRRSTSTPSTPCSERGSELLRGRPEPADDPRWRAAAP